ncbi:NAD(P)H-dependent flavin oxidoreductase [Algiphilus aromaticivorans]|uniref:NAD(P)H-dependent flavin oxidoreductase n=1 Tax=Algiphilus aromaticivorans TaxID=382454 RepID=UPI0005C26579|nr:nitronate monooxygenase [Algiphilus aromaticivorans]
MIQEMLGVEVPLIQAPMAGVQDSALAAAVSEAGALGSLPCARLDADGLRGEWQALRARSRRPCNVNFFCHDSPAPDEHAQAHWLATLAPYYEALGLEAPAIGAHAGRPPFDRAAAEALAELRPTVVSFHFGLPADHLLEEVRATGARVLSTATTVEEALWLERRGVDAVIAQGLEAGGHRGHFLSPDLTRQAGTFALLPQIARAIRVPVIAAGGIADAAGVRAAFALGASAVQVGTAFLLSDEARTSDVHRRALQSEAARHTALTNLFSGRPARAIVNRLMRELGPISDAVPPFPHALPALAPLRAAAEREGSGDYSSMWAGENTSGCRQAPAAKIVRGLMA